MANPGYNEEKSLVKDEDKVTGLVDSPSSQDDNHEPPLKKQHLTESESNSKSDFDSDTELINHASQDDYHELPLKKQHLTESSSNSKSDSDTGLINHGPPNSSPKMGTVAICYYDDDDDDNDFDEDEFSSYDNDNSIVKWRPYSWRTSQDDNHEPPLKKQHLTESESNSKSDSDSDTDTELNDHASQDDNNKLPLKKQHLTESNSNTELINHASQDDYHELPLKKQHLTESNSNSKSDSDTELINHGPPNSSPKMGTVAICYYDDDDDDDDDDEDEFYAYGNDNNIVKWGPYSWRTADRWNGREVYCIGVDAPTPCNQSISLKFLDMIGCGERFIGYSMEMKSFFFANLNKEEAARMEGLEGVRKVIPRRFCVSDI